MANNDIDTRNYTLKKLVSIFKEIATNHGQIFSFGQGNADKIGAKTIEHYPLMWIDYVPVNFTPNSIKWVFRIIIGDLVIPDESDLLNRRSDLIQILWDILYQLQDVYDLDVDFNETATPFTDNKVDGITGWYMDATINIPMNYTACDMPSKELEIISDENIFEDFDNTLVIDGDNSKIEYL